MKNLVKKLTVFFIFIFISFNSLAEPYFSSQTIDPNLITPPFSYESAEFKKDISQIIALQKKADKKEIIKALDERQLRPETIVEIVDPSLTRAANPKLYKLLDRASETSISTTENVKNYWNTKRPYLIDNKIKALIPPHDNPAYPSGHTCGSYVVAHILGLLIPQKRQIFYQRANEIAKHRVLVGMHYNKDLEGGKELALLIVGGLLQNEAFQKDFAAAKKELAGNFKKS
ncbi:MAG: phosphatase PAP2 family protein [Rickettsiales bacterium]|nr:phosphatase PAP2 family protein [Rickettsiales bacterium]